MSDRFRVEAFLPLKPSTSMVLLALAEGPSHGYAVRAWIQRRSGGSLELGTGQLYRLLARLLDRGWLEESPAPKDEAKDDPRRRYYRLTPIGHQVLRAEAARLEELVRLSRRLGVLGEEAAIGGRQ
ncbi:MAG: helix-turn-helix transcriptional regulator [Holophagales bacterium]|nr:helix-turn-helix transcriptional regulator [Holophagales bacterium]